MCVLIAETFLQFSVDDSVLFGELQFSHLSIVLHEHICLASVGGDAAFLMD